MNVAMAHIFSLFRPGAIATLTGCSISQISLLEAMVGEADNKGHSAQRRTTGTLPYGTPQACR